MINIEFGLSLNLMNNTDWFTYDYTIFNNRILKNKVKLSISKKSELMKYFDSQKHEAQEYNTEIGKATEIVNSEIENKYKKSV